MPMAAVAAAYDQAFAPRTDDGSDIGPDPDELDDGDDEGCPQRNAFIENLQSSEEQHDRRWNGGKKDGKAIRCGPRDFGSIEC